MGGGQSLRRGEGRIKVGDPYADGRGDRKEHLVGGNMERKDKAC